MNIEDMLLVGRTNEIMIEITTACNMRCSYCSVSHPAWQPKTMGPELVQRLITEIQPRKPTRVQVHGHGETTIVDGWCDYVEKLLHAGIPVSICTNLSKTYDDNEIDIFSRMANVTISLDTIEADLFRKLRRGGDIKNILYNLIRIIVRARSTRREPKISWSVVVCDHNIFKLLDLVYCGITLGINAITFCNLAIEVIPNVAIKLQHIAEMSIEDCKRALSVFTEITIQCLQNGIVCDIKPGIIDSLNYKIEHGHSNWTHA